MNTDNISADKNEIVKRMKHAITDPQAALGNNGK